MAIKIAAGRGNYSSLSGLTQFDEMMRLLKFRERFGADLLPGDTLKRKRSSYQKIQALIYGFIAGADCLDDMEDLYQDPGFLALCKGRSFAATTLGNFLRRFEQWQPRQINEVLRDMALKLRLKRFPKDRDFILDIDSTKHRQYAKKMEGAVASYGEHTCCLDSLQAFDQYGFQYWMDVRPGNTHTSNGAPTVIEKVFKGMPRTINRYMRGDRGYCNFSVFRACADYNVNFVIAMHPLMSDSVKSQVRNWRRAKKGIRFFDGRECEIGSTLYHPSRLDRETLRVVFIRARKRNATIFDKDPYEYRAWITNISEHTWGHEKVINFYKKRGNAENFIRELKNGYDMHHFPCQKLLANKVYGLLAAFAYNLMRLAAWNLDEKKARFSKMLRFRMVYLAGQVVKSARNYIIRVNQHHRKEVDHWLTTIKLQLSTG